jgi:hypothetical protein
MRDYKHEYSSYHAKPAEIKKRAQRNAARADMVKAGRAHKGDGKDVDHSKTPLRKGGGNSRGNLTVKSQAANRSWRDGKKGYD